MKETIVMENQKYYIAVEQGIASVVDAMTAQSFEMNPYFDGEVYGAYISYEEAAKYANQMNR